MGKKSSIVSTTRAIPRNQVSKKEILIAEPTSFLPFPFAPGGRGKERERTITKFLNLNLAPPATQQCTLKARKFLFFAPIKLRRKLDFFLPLQCGKVRNDAIFLLFKNAEIAKVWEEHKGIFYEKSLPPVLSFTGQFKQASFFPPILIHDTVFSRLFFPSKVVSCFCLLCVKLQRRRSPVVPPSPLPASGANKNRRFPTFFFQGERNEQ